MDSPVRQLQKRNDYLRHKMFRKINRRRRAKRQLEIEAPVKELKKRLRLKRTFEDGKDSIEKEVLRKEKEFAERLTKPILIGYDKDRAFTLTNAGSLTGAHLSEEMTDYLIREAEKAGVDLKIAFGIPAKESTFGNPTDDRSAWNLSSAIRQGFNNKYPGTSLHINIGGDAVNELDLFNFYGPLENQNPYTQLLNEAEKRAKKGEDYSTVLKEGMSYADRLANKPVPLTSIAQQAYEYYKKYGDAYNPGLKGYSKLVLKKGKEALQSPEIRLAVNNYAIRKLLKPKLNIHFASWNSLSKYAGGKDNNITNDDVNEVVEAGKEIVTGAVPFYGTYQDIKTAINEPSLSNISWALASAVSDGLLLSGIGSGLGILGKSLRATRGVSNAVRAVRDANRSYQLAKRGVTDIVTYNAKRNAVNQSLKKAAKKIVQSQEMDLGTEALEWGYKNDNNKWKPSFNFANGKDGDRISKSSDFSDDQLSRLVVDNSHLDHRYIYDPLDPMYIGGYINVLERNGWSINDPKSMLELRELYDMDQINPSFAPYAFDAGSLPEVTVKPDYNKKYNLILKTYYPFRKSRYSLTGHSELFTPGGNRISTNGDDTDYNFILNNCSDATRKALELAYHKAINPFLFTTPGDVKDFAELKLGGKTKTIPSTGMSITEIPVKLALLLQIANYAKQIEDTGKYAYGKDSGIHIKPENRGKFTRLKKRTGHSTAWFKAHGTPAQKKMATFAQNAKKWHH